MTLHQAARPLRRLSVPEITARKGKDKLVCLTAYTTPMAQLLDPHADVLLVGDTVGMVLHGLPTTLGVTMDMMVMHGQAVVRGSSHALVVVDMPFGSCEESPERAVRSAVRLMKKTGCQAVKVEAGVAMAATVRRLVDCGIPVMAHVGLKPQSVHAAGGFRTQGRQPEEFERVLAEARANVDAGAFALVVEGVTPPLAEAITQQVSVPTIGIGASDRCDGQILVTDDMLGMFERTPKFVRRYADLRGTISAAARAYAADVRSGAFPAAAELYGA